MRIGRRAVHTVFVLSLPLIVAAFGLGIGTAAMLVIVALLWRWALALTAMLAPPEGAELRLETIGASHFVEKVRWSMDRLGVPYTEEQNVGVLGVLFAGRTVPKLHIRAGRVISSVGNSPEILRYLWGRYATEYGERAAFLEPTTEALALERRLDRYGVNIQQWIYHHILPHRALTLHAWGADDPRLPAWQRTANDVLFPLLRIFMRKVFNLGASTHVKVVDHVEEFLGAMEIRLADGRTALLGGDQIGYVDITLAALSGLWLMPENYGAGKADATMPTGLALPPGMQAEMQSWRGQFPHVVAHIERLYATERILVSS